ncbi:unnamed protein product [Diatraea saccharalis]|uniref:Serpin domain-containing protein n=1 Tax=Diatraea saccharalis TaxID=40085 RepID=A0A9N9RA48_9NEOP|nr:unnamed protein product [Diatraea saccharalis]
MRTVVFSLYIIASCHCAIQFSDRPRNFSIELVHYTQLETDGHVVISPFGIWTLMTGIALGATGNSFDQLARAFILPKDSREIIRGYKELTSIVLNTKTKGVALSTKNFVFLDNNFKVFPEFRRTLESDFGAAVEILDFKSPNAADIANSKIERTGATVRNVLHSDDFAQSRMILANAISFKGLWASPFNKSETKVEIFYDENKNPIGRVNMMYQNSAVSMSNIKLMQSYALEMPYGNDGKYSMLFLLPLNGVKIADVYRRLAHVNMWDIFEQLKKDSEYFEGQETEVRIPRFKIRTNVLMNKPLIHMGVFDIFEADRARFDRIANEDIFISAIAHTADIEVTESGTVASATSTASFVDKISSHGFVANRPFIYFLMEKSTMTMIFGGIYSKPTIF